MNEFITDAKPTVDVADFQPNNFYVCSWCNASYPEMMDSCPACGRKNFYPYTGNIQKNKGGDYDGI